MIRGCSARSASDCDHRHSRGGSGRDRHRLSRSCRHRGRNCRSCSARQDDGSAAHASRSRTTTPPASSSISISGWKSCGSRTATTSPRQRPRWPIATGFIIADLPADELLKAADALRDRGTLLLNAGAIDDRAARAGLPRQRDPCRADALDAGRCSRAVSGVEAMEALAAGRRIA